MASLIFYFLLIMLACSRSSTLAHLAHSCAWDQLRGDMSRTSATTSGMLPQKGDLPYVGPSTVRSKPMIFNICASLSFQICALVLYQLLPISGGTPSDIFLLKRESSLAGCRARLRESHASPKTSPQPLIVLI